MTFQQVRATRAQIAETTAASRNQLQLSERGQVTDRYTKAVEQVGHKNAPVRLGALYSLEHLAQDNPEYRQTVTDVLCAYLRMPFTLPTEDEPTGERAEAAPPADDRDQPPHRAPVEDPAQELQVRQAAQRILADHLRLPPGILSVAAQRRPPSSGSIFWPDISLDLTGATLVNLDFASVSVVWARFDKATFHGTAWFDEATFQGTAQFDKAIFHGTTQFVKATFQGTARFVEVTFVGDAGFRAVNFKDEAIFANSAFQRDANFGSSTFGSFARFGGVTFQEWTGFGSVRFEGDAEFVGTRFVVKASFDQATFQEWAGFEGTRFQGIASFSEATFQGHANFDRARFHGFAWFNGATFLDTVRFLGAQVLHFDDEEVNERREWPDGYTVRPDPADPTRGTLVRAEQTQEP
jgi:uncharacterized protein YjbI with pentapeptide repeats